MAIEKEKLIEKTCQASEGLKDPKYGLPLGAFSSLPPFFKDAGVGVTCWCDCHSLGFITSAIFIPLLTAMPAPPAPGVT